jgi:hypothetical protein
LEDVVDPAESVSSARSLAGSIARNVPGVVTRFAADWKTSLQLPVVTDK